MAHSKLTSQDNFSGRFDTSTHSRLVVKIALLFSLLILISVSTSGYFSYRKNVQLILQNLQNQLQLAANTVATAIDGDAFQRLQGKPSIGKVEYQAVKSLIQRFMVNSYLGFDNNSLYAFRQISGDSLEFVVMLDEQYIGNRYAVRAEMLPALVHGQPSYTGIYEDENGMWVSAYAPILNSRNQVVGMIEADFHNNIYLMAVKDEIYSIILHSVAWTVVAVLIAILLSRLITRPITQISAAAIQVSQGDFNVNLPLGSPDEIGMLSRAFKFMVQEIQEKEFIRRKNQELTIAYKRLDELNHSLREANQVKSEFLSIAAHDLKNPLQVIMGFAETILELPGQEARIYRDAQKIYDASQRMLRLITHLLDTTAVESGKLTLRREWVDLNTLGEKVVAVNRSLAQRKGQRLLYSGRAGCHCHVDAERLYEVIDNLVNNAIKFSPVKSKIAVRVQLSDMKDGTPKKIRLEVADEGPGLKPEDMPRLFGKFARLSALPTGGETTTGLGLSIVKKLVELHGGRVWAENRNDKQGSVFRVELPWESPAGKVAEEVSVQKGRAGRQAKL